VTSTTGAAGSGVTGVGVGVTGVGAGGAGVGVGVGTVGAGGVGTTTGTGGAGGAGGGAAGKLGAACKADADCGGGAFVCLKSSDNLSAQSPGGVGNGICTVDCTASAAACAPLGGICVGIDADATGMTVTRAFCFEDCDIGPPLPQAPAFKCHGRTDVACEPVNAMETLFSCIPLCETDADCGTRKCEASSGLCVDAPKAGKAVGAGCTVTRGSMAPSECAGGLCLPIESIPDGGTTTPGICTALCRLGAPEACGYRITPIDAGPPMGGCVLPWGDTGYNTGDLGLCLQLCDNANDCSYKAANWTCRTDIRITDLGHSICLVPNPG